MRPVRFDFQRCTDRHAHRGLGGAVGVDHHPTWSPLLHHLGRARFTDHHQCCRLEALSRKRPDSRRCLGENVDMFANEQGVEVFRRYRDLLRHNHHSPTTEQGTEDLPHRHVERERMALRPHTGVRQAAVECVEKLGHVVVGYRNALGPTGGAGGVDQICGVFRGRHRQAAVRLITARAGTGRSRLDDGQATPGQPVEQAGGGDRGHRSGIAQDELQSGIGYRRIDR
nr:hypothetical protein CPGR_06021 [Mycolicibacterium fortuitum subsp. fortuitum DSM 46621 = ATCC 6841 = JCM 6387]